MELKLILHAISITFSYAKPNEPDAMGKSETSDPLQCAALPFCHKEGAPRVMLDTSRETGRWVIPKGWPMQGRRPCQVAKREAFE